MHQGIPPAIEKLRMQAPCNELSYGFVMSCLEGYSAPRAKLTKLLNAGALIRVKKGLYVFGPLFQRGPISKEVLANLIYGPSYISLEWALQHYRMLPEAVVEVTSVTTKPAKIFTSPIGRFSYAHCHAKNYPMGIVQVEFSEYQRALMATPEKAACDLLVIRRGKVNSLRELTAILLEDYRFEPGDLIALDIAKIQRIYLDYPHSSIEYFIKYLTRKSR